MEIDERKLYSPQEIVQMGVIKSPTGKSSYAFILKLIKAGILKSANAGMGKTPYFKVRGADINVYVKYAEEQGLQ